MDTMQVQIQEQSPAPAAPAAQAGASGKKKTLVVALPGREFSGNFLVAWTKTLTTLYQSGYTVVLLNRFSSFVAFSRMQTLGLDVLRGADQKPFGGQLEYDVWLTIDSDVLFSAEQVIQLIEATDIHPVVSGFYRMADLTHYAAVQEWDTDFFASHGSFQFLTPEDVEKWRSTTQQRFMPVVYNGLGFFACKKGVIESLQYPYFWAPLQEITTPSGVLLRDMCSEDVAFCKNLRAAGYTIMADTDIRVGHEKTLTI
jgi:hypothetical protein